jgi:hypothetical protein
MTRARTITLSPNSLNVSVAPTDFFVNFLSVSEALLMRAKSKSKSALEKHQLHDTVSTEE